LSFCGVFSGSIRSRLIRVVRKLQFLNNFLRKLHFCRALARRNARLVREPTGFPNKSIILKDDTVARATVLLLLYWQHCLKLHWGVKANLLSSRLPSNRRHYDNSLIHRHCLLERRYRHHRLIRWVLADLFLFRLPSNRLRLKCLPLKCIPHHQNNNNNRLIHRHCLLERRYRDRLRREICLIRWVLEDLFWLRLPSNRLCNCSYHHLIHKRLIHRHCLPERRYQRQDLVFRWVLADLSWFRLPSNRLYMKCLPHHHNNHKRLIHRHCLLERRHR
jgi:hypothetical protein